MGVGGWGVVGFVVGVVGVFCWVGVFLFWWVGYLIVINDCSHQREFTGRFAIVCQRKLKISISSGKSIP